LLIFGLFATEQAAEQRRRQRALGRFTRCGSRLRGLLYCPFRLRLGFPRSSLFHFHFLFLPCRTGPFHSLCFLGLRLLPLLRHDRSPDLFTMTPVPPGLLAPRFYLAETPRLATPTSG